MEIISQADARERGLKRFFTGVLCGRQHNAERLVSNGRCIECVRERRPAVDAGRRDKLNAEMREYRAKNLEKIRENEHRIYQRLKDAKPKKEPKPPMRERRRAYYLKNRDAILLKGRERYARNSKKAAVVSRAYREKNKDILKARRRAKYLENAPAICENLVRKRRDDPNVAFTHRARGLTRGALSRSGYRKSRRTESLLGCSIEEFRRHIERQFLPGMGWHNMSLWHIDHIVPVSSATSIAEAESLCLASNLRPLWAKENYAKWSRRTHLL